MLITTHPTLLHQPQIVPIRTADLWSCSNVSSVSINLRIATANVLTLQDPKKFRHKPVAFTPGRLDFLREAFKKNQYHLIGVQEANASIDSTWQGGGMFRICQGGRRGTRVVELWASDNFFASDNDEQMSLDRKSFTLIDQHEGAILVRYSHEIVCFDVLVAHAPGTRIISSIRKPWWIKVNNMLLGCKNKTKFPLIVLGDFNSSIGSITSAGIGSLGESEEDANGKDLRLLSGKSSFVAPSTFDTMHTGDNFTYTSPCGHDSRKDFVLVDKIWKHAITTSIVDDKIDLSLSRADHRVVYVDLAFTKKVGRTTDGLAIPGFDAKRLRDPKVIAHLRNLISQIDNVPWAIDPDSHANYISWQLRMSLACAAPISKAGPRMECMSDDTWKSHASCVELSKSVKTSKRVERRLCCNVFFALWHTVTTKSRDVASMVLQFSIGYNQFVFQKCRHIIDEYDRLDSHIHRDTLMNWWFAELRLSRMRAATKDLIAADKAKKVEAITMQISDPMSYKDSAKFWQLLHSAVPSLNKKTSIKPIASLKLEDGNMATDYNSIRARWQRHFASIELGEIMEYDDLCQKVRCARNHTLSVTSLIDLPIIFHT